VTTQPTAAPGWYPDPYGQAGQRWFDGREWTGDVHPRPAPPPSGRPQPTVLPAGQVLPRDRKSTTSGGAQGVPQPRHGAEYWLIPVGRSWQAVLAPWIGLAGIVIPLLGLAGIGFGVWALRVPSGDGRRGGRIRPVVAIVLGFIGTVYWALVVGVRVLAGTGAA
jgi:hypothetical protein